MRTDRPRRIAAHALALSIVALASAACVSVGGSSTAVERESSARVLSCAELGSLVLMAQTVPTATLIPCVQTYPPGWVLAGVPGVSSGSGAFSLSSDIAGDDAVTVTLTASCDTSGAIPNDDFGEPGTTRLQEFLRVPDETRGLDLVQYYLFDGGCVVYRYVFQPGTPGAVQPEMDLALTFVRRADVAGFVEEEFEQTLCGAGRTCVP